MEVVGCTIVYMQLAEIYGCFATFGAISLFICTHTSHVGIFKLIIRKIVK